MTALAIARTGFDLGFLRPLSRIADLFVSIAAAQQATNYFERMNNRTDAQLSANGMHRADRPRVIYNRHFN